jgi:hypothetical protein
MIDFSKARTVRPNHTLATEPASADPIFVNAGLNNWWWWNVSAVGAEV